MARFCPLYSGSSGNSTYVGYDDGGIIIDMGVSCKKIVEGLKDIDQSPQDIKGIFITHEHSDHIAGLNIFIKKYNTPLFATEKTLNYLFENDKIPGTTKVRVLDKEGDVVHGMNIVSFSTPHDAVDSVGYRVETMSGVSMAVATDLGHVTDEIRGCLLGSDLVLLESNYDERMLETGPYHSYLKNRVRGSKGHLSNIECAKTILDLVKHGTTRIVLGHLSSNNNRRTIAYNTTLNALLENNLYEEKDYLLNVAKRHEVSKIMYI